MLLMGVVYETRPAQSDWQSLAEALETPLLLVDADGVIVRANTHARDLLHTDDVLLGEPLWRFANHEPWHAALDLVCDVNSAVPFARIQATDDASGVTWDVSVTFQKTGHWLIALRDVTNLLALERGSRQNERVADLGRLVGHVAHEVRNPLFAMSATVDALEARFGSAGGLDRYVSNLRRELGRITALMQDLLEYGKPPVLDARIEPLLGAVEDAALVAYVSAEERRVRIAVDVAPSFAVLMDRARIAQALKNVLENAIHYSPEGGVVNIRADVAMREGQRWVVCSVEDSGGGFPEDAVPLVFEPFYTTRAGGTGLGLSIVQRIVQIHGGRVFAANRSEGGASITMWLPLRGDGS